jgi:hypothetical protein
VCTRLEAEPAGPATLQSRGVVYVCVCVLVGEGLRGRLCVHVCVVNGVREGISKCKT